MRSKDRALDTSTLEARKEVRIQHENKKGTVSEVGAGAGRHSVLEPSEDQE
jgi:hypothetical protein